MKIGLDVRPLPKIDSGIGFEITKADILSAVIQGRARYKECCLIYRQSQPSLLLNEVASAKVSKYGRHSCGKIKKYPQTIIIDCQLIGSSETPDAIVTKFKSNFPNTRFRL